MADQSSLPVTLADGELAALAGRQTRWHRDLDLAVDAADLGRWVDVHPVAFAEDGSGSGSQADLDGRFFDYPPGAFSCGLIAGRGVPCLSARQQRRFRTYARPGSGTPRRTGPLARTTMCTTC